MNTPVIHLICSSTAQIIRSNSNVAMTGQTKATVIEIRYDIVDVFELQISLE